MQKNSKNSNRNSYTYSYTDIVVLVLILTLYMYILILILMNGLAHVRRASFTRSAIKASANEASEASSESCSKSQE